MILDFKRGEDYIEVLCGASNKKYGDYVGRLKINNEGQYFITCECCPKCPLVSVTLEAFEKHALREGSGRWKRNIWVHCVDEDKVPLWKTPLIKKQNFHRDEFLRCTRCGKERRFHLKSRPDIKNYHDALNNKCWTCSLWPYQNLKASRGCSRSSTCQGCSTCYCEGCIKCHFEDCNCQECRDFMLYAKP
ncbi:hypothetical protein GYH30_016224 [Glycine max]|nr:hypothetical protein GYH30_016224 [Glycine max]